MKKSSLLSIISLSVTLLLLVLCTFGWYANNKEASAKNAMAATKDEYAEFDLWYWNTSENKWENTNEFSISNALNLMPGENNYFKLKVKANYDKEVKITGCFENIVSAVNGDIVFKEYLASTTQYDSKETYYTKNGDEYVEFADNLVAYSTDGTLFIKNNSDYIPVTSGLYDNQIEYYIYNESNKEYESTTIYSNDGSFYVKKNHFSLLISSEEYFLYFESDEQCPFMYDSNSIKAKLELEDCLLYYDLAFTSSNYETIEELTNIQLGYKYIEVDGDSFTTDGSLFIYDGEDYVAVVDGEYVDNQKYYKQINSQEISSDTLIDEVVNDTDMYLYFSLVLPNQDDNNNYIFQELSIENLALYVD